MFGIPLNYLFAAGLAIAALPVVFPDLLPYLGKGVTALFKRSPATPAKPVRLEVLGHLDAAFSYFETLGCKEGMDAIRTAGQHAFEHREAA
jgi:hypothetical protein